MGNTYTFSCTSQGMCFEAMFTFTLVVIVLGSVDKLLRAPVMPSIPIAFIVGVNTAIGVGKSFNPFMLTAAKTSRTMLVNFLKQKLIQENI